jgi:ABC-type multidrug transport system permease subunit
LLCGCNRRSFGLLASLLASYCSARGDINVRSTPHIAAQMVVVTGAPA